MREPRVLLGLVFVLIACRGPSCGAHADWVALVESFAGQVTVRLVPGAPAEAARPGLQLRVGAQLQTGPRAEARLGLRNGGHLTVKPGSVVTFHSSAPARELSLELLSGTLQSSAPTVEANTLVISVGKRTVRLSGRSRATVASPGGADPTVAVELGQAVVTGPEGARQTIFAGAPITLQARPRPEPDAGPPADAATVVAPEIVYYLAATGPGQVTFKGPGDPRHRPLRRGSVVALEPETQLRLARRARAVIGTERGRGTSITGPARLTLRAPTDPQQRSPLLAVQHAPSMTIGRPGSPGATGAVLLVEGVRVTPRVRHRDLEVQVRRERAQATVTVNAGSAILAGSAQTVELEARQRTTVRRGQIAAPQLPPIAPLQIRRPSAVRVFTSSPWLPLTLRWKLPAGAVDAVVEVSRRPSLAAPLFSDRIRRRHLTIARVPRGALHWRVRPTDGEGRPVDRPLKGRLLLFKDTSHRLLQHGRRMQNTIALASRSTVVYYQNLVPRFTFRWDPIPGADSYELKILRETELSQPLVSRRLSRNSVELKRGVLGEGNYLWYVTGRDATGALVQASAGRRLSIRYDNATPDLQIRAPRDNLTVSGDKVTVAGVAMAGSAVSINGVAVTLDSTSRFSHDVSLRPGQNLIVIRVVDRRHRQSLYLRRVRRR